MGTINVQNLGKAYKQYPTHWSRLREWLTPGSREYHQLKWVLQDINFTVQPGEAVGIIGINGAGKSTLLKLITGTTQPTTGSVTMTGRVAAMLELGMGFHPDFTGRQNVIMAGQLLGLSSSEITVLIPEIEAFAEIGEYIDMPVRVYSSGMQMRLAFSVATAVRPDILIIDEALSVGDAFFQHKSFSRIREFRKQGTTLLIVSHDKYAIQSICDKAILIKSGKIIFEGSPKFAMDLYNASLADHQDQVVSQHIIDKDIIQTVSGSGEASFDKIKLLDHSGKDTLIVNVGELAQFLVDVKINSKIDRLIFGCRITDKYGRVVWGSNTWHTSQVVESLKRDDDLAYRVFFECRLGEGVYGLSVALHGDDNHVNSNYVWIDNALIFQVINNQYSNFIGDNWLNPQFSIEIKEPK